MFALIKLPIYAISEFSRNLFECGINGNGTYTLQLLRMHDAFVQREHKNNTIAMHALADTN